ncbi:MAG TPA: hypothetical protein VK610_03840 [Rhodothermales bacterium]|nr:hypothetical protein [Rhodothermales bacterium]
MLKSKPVPYEPYTPVSKPTPAEAVRAEEVLTTDEIRERIAARETGIREHLAGLKNELTVLDDVTVGGKPLLGHVRAHPMRALAYAAAAGAVVGVLSGLLSRMRRDDDGTEEEQTIRLLTSALLDDAADRVARGASVADGLRRAARNHAPTVYYAPGPVTKGPVREAMDLALKSALGFGVKMGMDMLSKHLTGTPEVFTAAEEASDNPPT